jgi:glycosyltransferase involved in cell wall biosynthesis
MLEVARARPDVRFVMVGDGPEREVVRRTVASLEGRVLWLGKVEHTRVPGIVARFDIGVAPDCGFYMSPLKVFEWMSAGKAVVAPDRGPLREVIDPEVHGLLYPPRTLDGLTAAVLSLIDAPELRRQLGAAAARRVRDSLTWTHNAQRVMEACERARRAHASPAPAS